MRVLFTNNPPLIKYGLAVDFQQLGHDTKIIGLWQVEQERQGAFFPAGKVVLMFLLCHN